MKRDTQQMIRLVERVFRLLRGRVSLGWAIGLVVLLVGYLVAQPYLESALGVRLPALVGAGDIDTTPPSESPSNPSSRPSSTPARTTKPKSTGFPSALRDTGRGVYESPAGLRYTRGSQHGHRWKHVMAHTYDQPDRPHKHGVFDTDEPGELVELLDAVYQQAEAGRRTEARREEGRDVYVVDLGRRVGYIGGEWGASRGRPAAQQVQLVLQGQNVITAYPVSK